MDGKQGPVYERVARAVEWPMMALAVIFVGLLAIEEYPRSTPAVVRAAEVASWFIWGTFALEYFALLVLARDRWRYVRGHVVDLLIVVIPALRVFRLLRLTRALRVARLGRIVSVGAVLVRQWGELRRSGQRRGIGYVFAGLFLLLMVGAYAVNLAEGPCNQQFASYGSCVWWALVTATTVGYGDAAPITIYGRVVASMFMMIGIAMFGLISATIAAHFVAQDQEDGQDELVARLSAIECELVALREVLSASTADGVSSPEDNDQEMRVADVGE